MTGACENREAGVGRTVKPSRWQSAWLWGAVLEMKKGERAILTCSRCETIEITWNYYRWSQLWHTSVQFTSCDADTMLPSCVNAFSLRLASFFKIYHTAYMFLHLLCNWLTSVYGTFFTLTGRPNSCTEPRLGLAPSGEVEMWHRLWPVKSVESVECGCFQTVSKRRLSWCWSWSILRSRRIGSKLVLKIGRARSSNSFSWQGKPWHISRLLVFSHRLRVRSKTCLLRETQGPMGALRRWEGSRWMSGITIMTDHKENICES